MNTDQLALICCLINNLQRTCYQLRFLSHQQSDIESEWEPGEEDIDTLAESILAGVTCVNKQLIDTAMLSKDSLISEINRQLSKHDLTKSFRLVKDTTSYHRVEVYGDIDKHAQVTFLRCGTIVELEELAQSENKRYLFLAYRDYGEIFKLPDHLGIGEFYGFSGDQTLATIFWPFLMPLDGTCYSVNGALNSILDLEISEK